MSSVKIEKNYINNACNGLHFIYYTFDISSETKTKHLIVCNKKKREKCGLIVLLDTRIFFILFIIF